MRGNRSEAGKSKVKTLVERAKSLAPSGVKALYREFDCFERDVFLYRKLKKSIGLDKYIYSQANYMKSIMLDKGFVRFRDYYRFIEGNPDEKTELRQRLTFQGSHFFREDGWSELYELCLPEISCKETIRVWCAGCSSGEEVYSAIMMLLDYAPIERIEMLATDYNDEMIARVKEARYGRTHYGEIPEKYAHYIVNDCPRFTFQNELVGLVQARNLNLLTDDYPAGFDLIICRNVIKFFSSKSARNVQRKLVRSLNPGGFLFLSNDETGRERLRDSLKKLGVCQVYDAPIYQRKYS